MDAVSAMVSAVSAMVSAVSAMVAAVEEEQSPDATALWKMALVAAAGFEVGALGGMAVVAVVSAMDSTAAAADASIASEGVQLPLAQLPVRLPSGQAHSAA